MCSLTYSEAHLAVKTDFRKLNEKFKRFKRETLNSLQRPLKRAIVNEINQGRTPVSGSKRRFERYSASYRRAISKGRFSDQSKKRSPVNLRLSGKLLRSLVSNVSNGILKISFTDKKAEFHQEGQGNLPVRKLLPGPGEKFSKTIQLMIREFVSKRTKQTFK